MGISFGNALSGAANSLANAAGGNQAGIAAGNQINQSNLLDEIQLARQQAQDQLARQSAQSKMALEGAQGNEASARAAAIAAPPPKGSVTLGPGQNLYGNNGDLLTAGPPDRQPAAIAAAADRQAAATAAAADKQRAAIDAQSANQTKASAAREYTDALTGYQSVLARNPTQTHPVLSHVPFLGASMKDDYAANDAQAISRVKAAWQSYKDAGGNPADQTALGLTSGATPPTAPTGTKPTAKDIVHAALNGQPVPE